MEGDYSKGWKMSSADLESYNLGQDAVESWKTGLFPVRAASVVFSLGSPGWYYIINSRDPFSDICTPFLTISMP